MKPVLFIFLILYACSESPAQGRDFKIDKVNNVFLKDGEPFQYVAGSFHYFRAHQDTWRDKLRKMRIGGLNVVDIYIQWSLHNPKDGEYTFDGIADVVKFVDIATEEGLLIILRPGPYICSELDNGGLPYWLATKYPGIVVRSKDPNYLAETKKWYDYLLPKFNGHWYGAGGNIIMVQVENEYGAHKLCDKEYLNFLKNLTLEYTGDNAILFTTDRPYDNELECGQIEDVFVTTDFGLASAEEVETHFRRLREVQPDGPLVNSEFYTGWLTHWQEPNARRDGKALAETLDIMLQPPYSASVNFYMYYGGTNFGFWAGANDWGIGKYMADITSYDYDAPLTEPGDFNTKFYDFRDVIKKYLPLPPYSLPDPSKKTKYPSITMRAVNHIFTSSARQHLATVANNPDKKLLTFEEIDQFSGFVLYESKLPEVFTRDPTNLVVEKLRDRALVYIDEKFVGVLSRENLVKSLPVTKGYAGKKLQIFVENQGRINFQENFDLKGILGNVTVQTFEFPYYEDIQDWTVSGYPFEDYASIESFINANGFTYQLNKKGWLKEGPVLFHGELNIQNETERHDTWFHVRGWGKGVLFVNGFNLGRYWSVGPQMTNYIPKEHLNVGINSIVILELQKAPANLEFNFSDVADFNEN